MLRAIPLLFAAFLLTACSSEPSFTRVSYDTQFTMSTCGNALNPDIYNPDKGPEGFVSYRSLFSQGYTLEFKRDFCCVFSFQLKEKDWAIFDCRYISASANAGSITIQSQNQNFVVKWLNYYQLQLDWDIENPDTGETIHTVALLHSGNIFST